MPSGLTIPSPCLWPHCIPSPSFLSSRTHSTFTSSTFSPQLNSPSHHRSPSPGSRRVPPVWVPGRRASTSRQLSERSSGRLSDAEIRCVAPQDDEWAGEVDARDVKGLYPGQEFLGYVPNPHKTLRLNNSHAIIMHTTIPLKRLSNPPVQPYPNPDRNKQRLFKWAVARSLDFLPFI